MLKTIIWGPGGGQKHLGKQGVLTSATPICIISAYISELTQYYKTDGRIGFLSNNSFAKISLKSKYEEYRARARKKDCLCICIFLYPDYYYLIILNDRMFLTFLTKLFSLFFSHDPKAAKKGNHR
jgi:hypothetical protein